MSSLASDGKFWNYIAQRYEGRVHRITRAYRPDHMGVEVHVMFRIPDGEADELEMYRRIDSVLNVVCWGKGGDDERGG